MQLLTHSCCQQYSYAYCVWESCYKVAVHLCYSAETVWWPLTHECWCWYWGIIATIQSESEWLCVRGYPSFSLLSYTHIHACAEGIFPLKFPEGFFFVCVCPFMFHTHMHNTIFFFWKWLTSGRTMGTSKARRGSALITKSYSCVSRGIAVIHHVFEVKAFLSESMTSFFSQDNTVQQWPPTNAGCIFSIQFP